MVCSGLSATIHGVNMVVTVLCSKRQDQPVYMSGFMTHVQQNFNNSNTDSSFMRLIRIRFFESLRNSFDSSRKPILRDILEIFFSYFIMKMIRGDSKEHTQLNIILQKIEKNKLSPFASWPGAMINCQWRELPRSKTKFYRPKEPLNCICPFWFVDRKMCFSRKNKLLSCKKKMCFLRLILWDIKYIWIGRESNPGRPWDSLVFYCWFNKIKIYMHRPGIEPGPPAWQASILPLNHRCLRL